MSLGVTPTNGLIAISNITRMFPEPSSCGGLSPIRGTFFLVFLQL
jgi:hypothetical protein